MKTHITAAWPHEGNCVACREAKVCNFCGMALAPLERCTNGRCGRCHRTMCTGGGNVAPGHGYGTSGTPWADRP